jgi:hypothetical protein
MEPDGRIVGISTSISISDTNIIIGRSQNANIYSSTLVEKQIKTNSYS